MKLTLKWVKSTVSKMDETMDINSHAFRTAVILLSSAVVGPNINKIAKFTGYSVGAVRQRARNLRANKVWVGSKVSAEWLDKKNGTVAFLCDCLVADGLLVRSK